MVLETEKGLGEDPAFPEVSGFEPGLLELPPEHPLNLIWSLWSQSCETPPPVPVLCLREVPLPEGNEAPDGRQAPPMSASGVLRELPRLESQVADQAARRLARCKPGEDGTPPDLDAQVQVFLPLDRMTAWALVYPPSGAGAGVSRELLEAALRGAGVTEGVDGALLDRLPRLPERYLRLFLLARGAPPVNGKDGSVIDLFMREPKRTLTEDDDGRVDYATVEIFQNVRKGDPICRVLAPTPGEDGRTVLGEKTPAQPGKPAFVPKGQNTELSGDGANLIASCEGHLEFDKKYFLVKPVLEIAESVDFSTGNINCYGDIHIRGDVRSGFLVHATGSITVDGVVEGSTVEAGNDIIIRKGVRGSGKALLRAGRNIFARYLEACSVYARQNLEAECIVSSKVFCDGVVKVRTGKGAIIGGETRAAREVSAKIVGAPSESCTCVFLGGRPCEESQRKQLARELEELEKELEKIEKQPDSPAKLRRMSKTRVHISANRMKVSQFDRDLAKLSEEEKHARGRLTSDLVYPGVEITSGAYFMRVTNETRKCITTVSRGDLTLMADL